MTDLSDTRAMLDAVFGSPDVIGRTGRYLSDHIEDLIAARVAAEREACARECESTYAETVEGQLLKMPCYDTPDECAVAIRSRSSVELRVTK